MFFGSQSHAFPCKHENHDLLTLATYSIKREGEKNEKSRYWRERSLRAGWRMFKKKREKWKKGERKRERGEKRKGMQISIPWNELAAAATSVVTVISESVSTAEEEKENDPDPVTSASRTRTSPVISHSSTEEDKDDDQETRRNITSISTEDCSIVVASASTVCCTKFTHFF